MDTAKLRVAREKLTRVFRYLEALNQHRNPAKREIREQLWNLWLHDLPEHAAIKKGAAKSKSSRATSKDAQNESAENASFVLRVQRPMLTPPPAPPAEIAEWLEAGWDDPSGDAVIAEIRSESKESNESPSEKFSDNPARRGIFERWKTRRGEWAETEKPARASMKLFEALYALYGRIEREAERVELVLGDGVLSWPRPEGDIYPPFCCSDCNCSSTPRCRNSLCRKLTIPLNSIPRCSNPCPMWMEGPSDAAGKNSSKKDFIHYSMAQRPNS